MKFWKRMTKKKNGHKWLIINRDGNQNYPLLLDDQHIEEAMTVENYLGSLKTFVGQRVIYSHVQGEKKKAEKKLGYII